MKNIGIIGFGNMGEAMVQGIRKNLPGVGILVVEKMGPRLKLAVEQYRVSDFTGDYRGLFKKCDLIILAIKPQDSANLLAEIKPFSRDSRIISILAGKPIDFFAKHLETDEIARFMPSLAASVGKSVTGISFSAGCTPEFRADALAVAQSIGSALEVPENLMPAMVGLSGSGIAYVFEFIHALALGGTRSGIPYASSLKIALDVLDGAVTTLKSNGVHPVDMVSRVCSPAGTTIEGIQALADGAFTATVMAAVNRASERAGELENPS